LFSAEPPPPAVFLDADLDASSRQAGSGANGIPNAAPVFSASTQYFMVVAMSRCPARRWTFTTSSPRTMLHVTPASRHDRKRRFSSRVLRVESRTRLHPAFSKCLRVMMASLLSFSVESTGTTSPLPLARSFMMRRSGSNSGSMAIDLVSSVFVALTLSFS
jgi:hypothetical protein